MSAAECEVAVVGAGIAGLACGLALRDRGRDAIVLEAAARPGGPVESARVGTALIERGPSTVRSTPELRALAEQVGVPLVEGRRAGPYLVVDGRLVAPSPGALLRGELLPLRALGSVLAEPFRPARPGPRSVEAFVRERFGAELAERFADVLTLGVFGVPASGIGFEAAFPALAADLARHGSLARSLLVRAFGRRGPRPPRPSIVSTPDGLSAIPAAVAARLGERLRLRCPVQSLRRQADGFVLRAGDSELRARQVVLAIPPRPAATLVDDEEAAGLLARYESTPQTLAAFTLDEPACRERWTGFGFLAPGRERLPLLGALFPTSLFPERAPAGTLLITVFVGPALRAESDGVIAKELAPVLKRLLESEREPELIDVARHPEGIVRYDERHPERTARVRARLRERGGPVLAGYAYDGVAFGAAAASGLSAADRALAPR